MTIHHHHQHQQRQSTDINAGVLNVSKEYRGKLMKNPYHCRYRGGTVVSLATASSPLNTFGHGMQTGRLEWNKPVALFFDLKLIDHYGEPATIINAPLRVIGRRESRNITTKMAQYYYKRIATVNSRTNNIASNVDNTENIVTMKNNNKMISQLETKPGTTWAENSFQTNQRLAGSQISSAVVSTEKDLILLLSNSETECQYQQKSNWQHNAYHRATPPPLPGPSSSPDYNCFDNVIVDKNGKTTKLLINNQNCCKSINNNNNNNNKRTFCQETIPFGKENIDQVNKNIDEDRNEKKNIDVSRSASGIHYNAITFPTNDNETKSAPVLEENKIKLSKLFQQFSTDDNVGNSVNGNQQERSNNNIYNRFINKHNPSIKEDSSTQIVDPLLLCQKHLETVEFDETNRVIEKLFQHSTKKKTRKQKNYHRKKTFCCCEHYCNGKQHSAPLSSTITTITSNENSQPPLNENINNKKNVIVLNGVKAKQNLCDNSSFVEPIQFNSTVEDIDHCIQNEIAFKTTKFTRTNQTVSNDLATLNYFNNKISTKLKNKIDRHRKKLSISNGNSYQLKNKLSTIETLFDTIDSKNLDNSNLIRSTLNSKFSIIGNSKLNDKNKSKFSKNHLVSVAFDQSNTVANRPKCLEKQPTIIFDTAIKTACNQTTANNVDDNNSDDDDVNDNNVNYDNSNGKNTSIGNDLVSINFHNKLFIDDRNYLNQNTKKDLTCIGKQNENNNFIIKQNCLLNSAKETSIGIKDNCLVTRNINYNDCSDCFHQNSGNNINDFIDNKCLDKNQLSSSVCPLHKLINDNNNNNHGNINELNNFLYKKSSSTATLSTASTIASIENTALNLFIDNRKRSAVKRNEIETKHTTPLLHQQIPALPITEDRETASSPGLHTSFNNNNYNYSALNLKSLNDLTRDFSLTILPPLNNLHYQPEQQEKQQLETKRNHQQQQQQQHRHYHHYYHFNANKFNAHSIADQLDHHIESSTYCIHNHNNSSSSNNNNNRCSCYHEQICYKSQSRTSSTRNIDNNIISNENYLPCTRMNPKGILTTSKQNSSLTSAKSMANRKGKNRRITFADSNPEIIGYRYPSDDEDDEDDKLETPLVNNKNENINGDENDSDDSDAERMQLKALTESNTLFNSNYANFKIDQTGGLGKPNPESNGPIRFKISDSYQRPLPEPIFVPNSSSVRQMFEKNAASNGQPKHKINKENENSKKLVANFRDIFENNNNNNSIINKNNENRKDNPIQLPRLKLEKKDSNTINKLIIQELDIDKIRIPRASIQEDKIKRNEIKKEVIETSTTIKDKYSSDNCKNNNDSENTNHNINNNNNNNETEPLILVNNREGSILTIDSKNISKIETDENELFYLPSVILKDCAKSNSKNSSSNDNNNNNNDNGIVNLDALSQSSTVSTSSGCCSVNSSSHSNSPTHIESCSSTSPTDSLDSSADLYDSTKSDLEPETESSSNEKENVSKHELNKDVDGNQMIISYALKPIDDFDQSRLTNIVVVDRLSSNVDKEEEIKDIFESWAKPGNEFQIFNDLPELNKMNDSISMKNNAKNNEIIVNTVVFNGKDNNDNNRQLKQTDSLSSNDKRSQMLARMALDLQKHRNESSLSRSDSNQSHNSFGKKASLEDSSFRDRLIKEAFEDDNVDYFSNKNNPLIKFQMVNGFESDNESQSFNTSDSEEEDNSIQEENNEVSTDSSSTSDDEDEERFSNQTNKKPFAKLFKTGFFNANKKYTKIVKKNLSKTSKFIVHTTQQLRNDTSDIVRKLKCDKKTASLNTNDLFEYNEKSSQNKFKHKWTLGDDEAEKSTAVRPFKLNFDMKKLKTNDETSNDNGCFSNEHSTSDTKSIEPTLVKIKRLESTKLFDTSKDNIDATPPIPQRLKTSKDRKMENGESQLPPKAPIRRKKINHKIEALTLSRVKSDLEKFYNVFDEKTTTLDNVVLVENVKPLFKDYRLYNCAIKLSDNKVNLLTSNTLMVTCCEQDFTLRNFQGQSCCALTTKWTNYLNMTDFCQTLKQIALDKQRTSLVDSIVLQLLTILAKLEYLNDNKSILNNSIAIGDINDTIIAISSNANRLEINDVLLILPAKMNDSPDDEESVFSSLPMMQLFFLKVFLMRLTRLTTDPETATERQMNQLSHFNSISKRLQTSLSLKQLKILSMVDCFQMISGREIELGQVKAKILAWFNERSESNGFVKKFYDSMENKMNLIKNITLLDYLEVDFVLNYDPRVTYQLVYNDLINNCS